MQGRGVPEANRDSMEVVFIHGSGLKASPSRGTDVYEYPHEQAYRVLFSSYRSSFPDLLEAIAMESPVNSTRWRQWYIPSFKRLRVMCQANLNRHRSDELRCMGKASIRHVRVLVLNNVTLSSPRNEILIGCGRG